MWSNAGALSACSGDMPRQVARGRVRDFSLFESQTTEDDPDETGFAPLPGRHSCDYGSQCLAELGRGTFQPMLHCKMICSVTGQQCSGRYHACCVTDQETQDSIPVLPPNACGLPRCILVNRRETPKQTFADGASAASGGREGGREGNPYRRHQRGGPTALWGEGSTLHEKTRPLFKTSGQRLCRVLRHPCARRPLRCRNQLQPRRRENNLVIRDAGGCQETVGGTVCLRPIRRHVQASRRHILFRGTDLAHAR